jgi:PBP1b-binding outer membrane lipoprotein LpoB
MKSFLFALIGLLLLSGCEKTPAVVVTVSPVSAAPSVAPSTPVVPSVEPVAPVADASVPVVPSVPPSGLVSGAPVVEPAQPSAAPSVP